MVLRQIKAVRKVLILILAVVSPTCFAQFKVDPQKIPVVPVNRHALIIGASNYQYLGKLNYSARDAQQFKDALVTGFRFSEDSIRLISDAENSQKKPIGKTILAELDQMLSDPRLDKGDLFILYFSGHGVAVRGSDFLCSTDSKVGDVEDSGLPVGKVLKRLSDAHLRNVVLIADACRAGEKNEFGIELYEQAKKMNIAVLLGCEPGHKSYEAPALRSGVFTYFLLKALSNPMNRTASGGLWTSRIAKSVEKSVFEYTQHDYGDNAQRPISFADPTSDVMLAKFIDRSPAGPAKNEDLAMTTDPKKNADELTTTAETQLAAGDFTSALESAKQALTLDATKLQSAYFAAISAQSLGRSGEHQKFCNLMTNSDNPYYRNFGVFLSNSRATPVDDRISAMNAFWKACPKDDISAIQIWSRARTYCSLAETKRIILTILPTLTSNGRLKAFFEGEVAFADGNINLAIEKYQAARKFSDGLEFLTNDILVLLEMTGLFIEKRTPELKVLLKEQFSQDKVSPMIWASGAAYLKLVGNRDAAIAIIKKGIKESALPEDDVVLVAVAMGGNLPEIIDDLDAQVNLHPFSWKLRTVAAIARGIKEKDANASAKAFEDASHYCDDEVEIATLAYKINEAILNDGIAQGIQKPERITSIRETYRLLFLNFVDRLGTDSEKWQILGTVGISSSQGPNTYRLFRQYIKNFNARATQGSDFYTILFQLATSEEDDAMAKFAVEHPSLLEPDRSYNHLLYVAYLLSKRDYVNAKSAFASVAQVSDAMKPLKSAVDAIFLARTGDKTPLINFLKKPFDETEEAQIGRGIAAISLADLGQGEGALPHLKGVTVYNLKMIPSMRFRCAEAEMRILKAQNKVAESDEILFDILQTDQVSPPIQDSFFGLKQGIAHFTGEFNAETKWFSDDLFEEKNPTHKDQLNMSAVGEGTISLKIDNAGIASGSIAVVSGETFTITGKVDDRGNLRGSAKSPSHTYTVEAKMLSNEFKLTESFKKSNVGQIVVFTDERGIQTRWLVPFSRMKA